MPWADGALRPLRRMRQKARLGTLNRRITAEVAAALVLNPQGPAAALALPTPYGQSLPERVVELLFARLCGFPGARVLDVGHANAMACHLDMVRALPAPRAVTGIDLAEPAFPTAGLYQRSVRASIASTGLPAGSFDLVYCISTLEHVGMDNSGYVAGAGSPDPGLAHKALAEMLRLLSPGGSLLLTVPFGRFEDHGWMLNYDGEHWESLLRGSRAGADVREWFFRHTFGAGWRQVEPRELAYVGYYDQANSGSGGLAVAVITTHRTRPGGAGH